LSLPDHDDRHVLAAAIHSHSSLIVTLNLADFPSDVLAAFDIEAQHPDDFVLALFEAFPDLVLEAAKAHRASLRNPPKNRASDWKARSERSQPDSSAEST
jgi:hypothetical protein